jgi:hypothetical protein
MKPTSTLTLDVFPNDDVEITCVYCKDTRDLVNPAAPAYVRRPCEYAVRFRDRNSTLFAGLHAACLNEFDRRK